MPLCYYATTIGTFNLKQDGKKYKIQIRQGNCLAVFMYIYKMDNPEDPSKPWMHQLVSFFANEQHIKNCMKSFEKKHCFQTLFESKPLDIKLNLYYKECQTLLKYMLRDGLKVQAYYKEPNKK